jgi:hypothetical protein
MLSRIPPALATRGIPRDALTALMAPGDKHLADDDEGCVDATFA